jgi:hypothetical protein
MATVAHRLNDDVLLLIFSYVDIDTFLDLRLLSQSVLALIGSHITFLCRSVARSTFPSGGRILMPPSDGIYNIKWLKGLRFKQVAAILLECVSTKSVNQAHWILAEDPLGDPLRAEVAMGLEFTAQLLRIKEEVSAIHPLGLGPVPDRYLARESNMSMWSHPPSYADAYFSPWLVSLSENRRRQKWEEWKRQDAYCRSVPKSAIRGFQALSRFLQAALDNNALCLILRDEGPKALWHHLWAKPSPFPEVDTAVLGDYGWGRQYNNTLPDFSSLSFCLVMVRREKRITRGLIGEEFPTLNRLLTVRSEYNIFFDRGRVLNVDPREIMRAWHVLD